MKKFFKHLFVVSIFINLSLFAQTSFKEHSAKILSINGNTATAKSFDDVSVGSSGVVVHDFDKKHSTIVAKFIVISKNKNSVNIKFVPFRDLKQDVLPVPKILPQVGDKAIFNFLYNYALPIAPNFLAYKEAMFKHKDIKWLHPDLFAAKLFADDNPTPTKKDFQKMCMDYNFYLLYFAIDHTGYFVDCNSFKVLKQEKIDTGKSVNLPFFSRIKDIQKSWFSFGGSKIDNYNSYYKNLIR